MDSPPPTHITRLPHHGGPDADAGRSPHVPSPKSWHPRGRSGGHLKLVERPDARVARQLDAIESAFSVHHEQMLTSLDALECELPSASESARSAHEQIAFMRVGLRCLADALGELNANLADLSASDTSAERPRPGAGGAA